MKRILILILIVVAFALVGCEVVLSEAPSVPPFNLPDQQDSHTDSSGQTFNQEGCYPQESCTPTPTPMNPTAVPTSTLQPNECQTQEQCLPAPTLPIPSPVCVDGDYDCATHQAREGQE